MQDSQVPAWGQCGGVYYTGSTTCVTGFTCVPQPGNIYYSQCLPNVPSTPPTKSPVTSPTVSELYSVATYEGYGYLLPLVISDYLRKDFIAASAVNQFVPIKQFANILVNAQSNLDTLYQPAWLDLTQGPQVVSVPDSKGRYYVLPIYDLWTEVLGVPGPRTTGGGAFTFVITPPNWTGTLPSGLWEIRATTFYIYILGRIYTTGTPADIAATNAFQDAFSINSLSNYINNIPPTVVTNTGIVQPFATASIQKAVALSADQLFAQAAELLKIHPPHSTDFSIIARLRRIGFVRGQSFNFGSLIQSCSPTFYHPKHDNSPTMRMFSHTLPLGSTDGLCTTRLLATGVTSTSRGGPLLSTDMPRILSRTLFILPVLSITWGRNLTPSTVIRSPSRLMHCPLPLASGRSLSTRLSPSKASPILITNIA